MCTAVSLRDRSHLFGRTLDLEFSYNEEVIVTPKRFCLEFLHEKTMAEHFALLGAGIVSEGVPLYYDAMNEKGLAIAALNFPHYAVYRKKQGGRANVASFELIPWVLSQCESVKEARELLATTNITDEDFSPLLRSTPLHWLLSDTQESIVLESTAEGIALYDDPYGVMTNSPPFSCQAAFLADHAGLSAHAQENRLCPDVPLRRYSNGLGGIGLPGDFSSFSRFVRAVFLVNHTAPASEEEGDIGRFFHLMDAIAVPCGSVRTDEGKEVFTVYTSCMDTAQGIYYFITRKSRQIRALRFLDAPQDSSSLYTVPMTQNQEICFLTPAQKRGKIRENTIS